MSLLSLIERDTKLKKVAGTKGGEWHGPCPFCGGRDRFVVQPNHGRGRWSCRRCAPKWQDDISYLMKRENIGFRAACERLGRPLPERRERHDAWRRDLLALPDTEEAIALRDDVWQAAAQRFASQCSDSLRAPEGRRALDYLLRRGLDRRALVLYDVGYNAEDRHETWGSVEVFLPRGIVLPWWNGDRIWKVSIRRPAGEPKYTQVRGGANTLYGWDLPNAHDVVVLVEGEFDMLSFWPPRLLLPGDRRVLPVATGSVSGARLTPYVAGLSAQWRVLVAFDADDAGDEAAKWWLAHLGSNARRLRPTRHDVNEMLMQGDDLYQWIREGLEEPSTEKQAGRPPAPMLFPGDVGCKSCCNVGRATTAEGRIQFPLPRSGSGRSWKRSRQSARLFCGGFIR